MRNGNANIQKTTHVQLSLDAADAPSMAERALGETFRRLYYSFYSNSSASRAEKIFQNLGLILLLKYSIDSNAGNEALNDFLSGRKTAAWLLDTFLPLVLPRRLNIDFSFTLDEKSLQVAMRELSSVDFLKAPAHVLGEAFQSLIGPKLRGDKGQFFTPRSLVRAMVEIVAPSRNESVLDPACGTGGFLGETYSFQSRQQLVAGNMMGAIVGIEKDADLARLATAMLHIVTKGKSELYCDNSLNPKHHLDELAADKLFDVVLTNPPFGSNIQIDDPDVLARYDLAKRWICSEEQIWRMTSVSVLQQDPQILFIELCVRRLKPNGRMGIVLPEGIFGNKQEGYIWDWIRTQGRITALLDCPRTTFQPGTDTKTNVLFFTKHGPGTPQKSSAKKTLIGVALTCGHDRRGRVQLPNGTKHPDDFQILAADFGNGRKAELWKEADTSTSNYLVPRYYTRDRTFSPAEQRITGGSALSTLGQLVSEGILSIKKGHEVGSHAYGTGDVPFVRTSDINNFEISADPTKSVGEEVYNEYKASQNLKSGDILMVVDGRYRIGATAMLSANNFRCVVQSHLRILSILQPEKLDPFELLFALNLVTVRIKIRDLVFVQSTLGTLGGRLRELEVPLLHGSGPWQEKVEQFKLALTTRDALLSSLRDMSGPEVEL